MRAVHVKDKVRFAKATIAFLGDEGLVSFEGHLSHFHDELEGIPGATWEETPELRWNTLVPRLDFVVVPLEPRTTEQIVKRIIPRIGILRRVIHFQIAKHGALQLGAYDNFDPDCTVVGPAVSDEFLQDLVNQGILDNFEPTSPPE